MAAHQAAGSCHKGPSGASTRAGLIGTKIAKKRRLLPSGSFRAVDPEPIGFPTIPGRRPACRIATSHGLAAALRAIAARRGEAHYVWTPRRGRRGGRLNQGIRRTDDDGRSRQGCRKKRRGCEGFATGPAETGVARKSQAAEVAGAWAQRGEPTFRKRRRLPRYLRRRKAVASSVAGNAASLAGW
jgi:hypothetical protein